MTTSAPDSISPPAQDQSSATPVATAASEKRSTYDEYMKSLHVPTSAEFDRIAKAQASHVAEIDSRYREERRKSYERQHESLKAEQQKRTEAAGKIQRVYRGHRARRAMRGLSLDPSTRWDELLRDARFQQLNNPRRRSADLSDDGDSRAKPDGARNRWQHIGNVALHAQGRTPENDSSSSESEDLSAVPKPARRFHKRLERKEKRAWQGKAMGLPYFLEMVDMKHRYGSNLRSYHEEWMKADTRENFFYWLDHGEGKHVELSSVSRESLEREQVRYLSREERTQYLIKVDSMGRLRWNKNDEVIDTTTEFRDSIDGIVPLNSASKSFRQDELEAMRKGRPGEAAHGSDESSENSSEAERRYPDSPKHGAKKIIDVSPATIMNRLMRKSVRKNTWIFVADTNMNVYVGIKQSGSFQHSSFIQGSRVSAAGLIKVKQGQLRSLAPLSGHYRPPAMAFKNFLDHLKASGVDMSRTNISKSYAILIGLEAYKGGKQKLKDAGTHVGHGIQHIVHPSDAKERKEQERDKTESAQREQAALRKEAEARPMGKTLMAAKDKIGTGGDRPPAEKVALPDRTNVEAA